MTPTPVQLLFSSRKVSCSSLSLSTTRRKSRLYFILENFYLFGNIIIRGVVARRVSFDDGDSGTHNTDAAVRIQGAGVGPGIYVFNGDGNCYVLLLPSNV